MDIANDIDPVALRPLFELAERGSTILRDVAGNEANLIDFPIHWSTPSYHPAMEPPTSQRPLMLNAINQLGETHFAMQLRPQEFDDPELLRYKLLRFWAGCLRMRSENQMRRLDQLVKNIDGD